MAGSSNLLGEAAGTGGTAANAATARYRGAVTCATVRYGSGNKHAAIHQADGHADHGKPYSGSTARTRGFELIVAGGDTLLRNS